MKRICTFLAIAFIFSGVQLFAQEEKDEITVKIGGFVRYEAYYDTYQSVVARDGELYLYPNARNLDSLGNDINESGILNMLTVITRVNAKVTGPEIFGAKSSGLVEGDFFSTANATVRLLRLRHAYMKLNWDKSELLMGHSWHPFFVTKCIPGTLTMAAAVPFNPLNRSALIKGTLMPVENVSLSAALVSHTYHRTIGDANQQRNSGLPDFNFQAIATPGDFVFGGTVGYKTLKPRLATADGVKTEEMIASLNLQAFATYTGSNFSLKAMTVYGENPTHLVSIGGFGAAQDPSVVDNYSYINLKTLTYWGDVTILKNPQIGIFYGYAKNMEPEADYYSIGTARGENLAYTYRISPRITYKVKNLKLGVELLHAVSVYGNYDATHNLIDTQDPTTNKRFLFMAQYTF